MVGVPVGGDDRVEAGVADEVEQAAGSFAASTSTWEPVVRQRSRYALLSIGPTEILVMMSSGQLPHVGGTAGAHVSAVGHVADPTSSGHGGCAGRNCRMVAVRVATTSI